MGKMIGAAEFKKNCLRIISDIEKGGEAVTVTKRGRPVAELKPIVGSSRAKALFGSLKGSVTFGPDFDPSESCCDPGWEEVWDANNPPELYSKR